mgnify:CR=1 FL=1
MTQEIRIRRWLAFLLAALLAFSTLSTALAAGKTFQSYQTTSMSNVNLRKRANGTSTILKRIKVGDTVTIVGKSGNYYQIQFDGKEGYALGEDVQHLDQVVITPRQKRTTVAFLISFVLLVGYGIATKQGTNYALMVMIVLAAVVAIFGGIEIDRSVDCITKGVASQANMFLIFVSIDVLLNLVTLGGGFDALSNLLGGLAGNSPTAVMLVASVVGGFGIEAAAVAEIQIITDMFGGLATQVGLPMGCFAVSILAATRLTGSAYPTTNFAGQLGTAQCSNTKEALQACWISVAFACVFVVAYSFIGPLILG